jgi:hypothetical protein
MATRPAYVWTGSDWDDIGDKRLGASVTALESELGSKLNIAGGKILQIVGATHATEVSTTSESAVTTNLSASITPSNTNNKVLILAQMPARKTSDNIFAGVNIRLYRGSVAGTSLATNSVFATGANATGTITFSILDSPNTTGSQTYTLGVFTGSSATTVASCPGGATASMVLLEVSA